MLQSIDNYINEKQPTSVEVNPENCYNTIMRTNNYEEARTLFIKVALERHDFKCRIDRDTVCLTFVNSKMFYKDKNIVRDFAPVFIVAKNLGLFFIDQLNEDAKNTIQSLLYTHNVLIPLHISAGKVFIYGVSSAVRSNWQTVVGGKINVRRIQGEYLFYYGEMFPYPWSVENAEQIKRVIGVDIFDVNDKIVNETSVKHSIL